MKHILHCNKINFRLYIIIGHDSMKSICKCPLPKNDNMDPSKNEYLQNANSSNSNIEIPKIVITSKNNNAISKPLKINIITSSKS